MTIAAVAVKTGFTQGTIHSWKAGRRVPFRASAERLAQAVNEPELVDLIDSRPGEYRGRHTRLIRMTCRECGGVRDEEAGLVRAYERIRDQERISVDWERDEATHICHDCSSRAVCQATVRQAVRTKRSRKKGRHHVARHLKSWRERNPAALAAAQRTATAAAAQKQWQDDKLASARRRLGLLALKPKGTITPCAYCQKIVFLPSANTGAQRSRGGAGHR